MSLEQQTVDGVRRNYFARIETVTKTSSSKLAKYFVREMFKRLSQGENTEGSKEVTEENNISDIIAKAEEDGASIYKTKDEKEIKFIKKYAFQNKIPILHKYNKETEEHVFVANPEVMDEILDEMQNKAKEIEEKEVNKILNATEKELAANVQKMGNKKGKNIAISNLSEVEANSIIRKFMNNKSVAIDYSVTKESTYNGHETYRLTIPEVAVINENADEPDIEEALLQTRLELDGQFADDRYDEEMDYLRISKGMETGFSDLLGEKNEVIIASKDSLAVISIKRNGFNLGSIERDNEGNAVIHKITPEPKPTVLMQELEYLRANEKKEKKFSFTMRDKKNEKTRSGVKVGGNKHIEIVIKNPTGKKGDAIIKVNNLEKSPKEAIEFLYRHSDGAGIKSAYRNLREQHEDATFYPFQYKSSERTLRNAIKAIDRPQIIYNKEELHKHLKAFELQGKQKSVSKKHKDQTAVFSKSFSRIVKEELAQDEEFNQLHTNEKIKKVLDRCGVILANLQNYGTLSEGDLTGDRVNKFMDLYKKYDGSIAQCSAVQNQLNKMCRNIKCVDEIELNRLSRGTTKEILEKEIQNIKPGCKKEFTLRGILNASRDYDKKLERTPHGRVTIERTAKGKPEIFLDNQKTNINAIVGTISDCFEKGAIKYTKNKESQFEYER